MRVVTPPKEFKCSLCECTVEIKPEDVWMEFPEGIYCKAAENLNGKRYVVCPICQSRIYLEENKI